MHFSDYNCNLLVLESMCVFLGYIDNGETQYDWSSERNNILLLHLAKNCTEKNILDLKTTFILKINYLIQWGMPNSSVWITTIRHYAYSELCLKCMTVVPTRIWFLIKNSCFVSVWIVSIYAILHKCRIILKEETHFKRSMDVKMEDCCHEISWALISMFPHLTWRCMMCSSNICCSQYTSSFPLRLIPSVPLWHLEMLNCVHVDFILLVHRQFLFQVIRSM